MQIKTPYQQYLDSDHWKLLRKEALAFHGAKCCCCPSTQKLQVHHVKYHDWYSVQVTDLRVLCDDCHEDIHLIMKTLPKEYDHLEKWEIAGQRVSTSKLKKPVVEKWNQPLLKEAAQVRVIHLVKDELKIPDAREGARLILNEVGEYYKKTIKNPIYIQKIPGCHLIHAYSKDEVLEYIAVCKASNGDFYCVHNGKVVQKKDGVECYNSNLGVILGMSANHWHRCLYPGRNIKPILPSKTNKYSTYLFETDKSNYIEFGKLRQLKIMRSQEESKYGISLDGVFFKNTYSELKKAKKVFKNWLKYNVKKSTESIYSIDKCPF